MSYTSKEQEYAEKLLKRFDEDRDFEKRFREDPLAGIYEVMDEGADESKIHHMINHVNKNADHEVAQILRNVKFEK